MKRIVKLCILMAALVTAFQASAQFALTEQMQKYVASPVYAGVINNALGKLPPEVFTRCPTLTSPGSKVVVLKPVTFGLDNNPTAGVWKQMFPVSGCSNDTVLNFIFSVGADTKINTMILMPGYTRADPTLQRDSIMYANMGALHVDKDCKNWVVKNTRFEAYGLANPSTPDPGPEAKARPWWETWVLVGCGHVVEVPMDYSPDERGTTIIQPGGVKDVTR